MIYTVGRAKKGFISIGKIVCNFSNPFRASQGTTFRYMTRHQVQNMKVKIFNLSGSPIDALGITGSNEVKWHNPQVHVGLYVYLVEAELGSVERRDNSRVCWSRDSMHTRFAPVLKWSRTAL